MRTLTEISDKLESNEPSTAEELLHIGEEILTHWVVAKDLAPTNELEIELLRYLMQKYKHVSYERVCSGIGIPNIYNFVKDSGRAEEPDWLAREMVNIKDATPLIVNTALKKEKSCFKHGKNFEFWI